MFTPKIEKVRDCFIFFVFCFPETSNDVENQKKSTKKLSSGKSVDIHGKCLYKLLILNKNRETFTPYIKKVQRFEIF